MGAFLLLRVGRAASSSPRKCGGRELHDSQAMRGEVIGQRSELS